MIDIREEIKESLLLLLRGLVIDGYPVFPDQLHNQEFLYLWADKILSIPIIKSLLEKLKEGELYELDADQRTPTDKGVNIKFKANPELSMPAQKEITETAIMAYKQAEQDMKDFKKVKQLGG